ncbi:MAG: WD40 domain-containing protein, partial [Planctomycetota bacterium]
MLLGGKFGADLLIGGPGTNTGDGQVDLTVTVDGEPKKIEVGDTVVYKHIFTNVGPDIAVNTRIVGNDLGVVTALPVTQVIGTPILDPITGVDTGLRAFLPGNSFKLNVPGTGTAPGVGGYQSAITFGEANVYIDPVAENNKSSAETTVLPRVAPPRVITKGRPPTGTGSSNSALDLGSLSGSGNFVSFGTNVSFFEQPLYQTPAAYSQVGVGDPILVSVNAAGTSGGNSVSSFPVLNTDGTKVVFYSLATDLVTGFVDNNGAFCGDLFYRDVTTGVTQLVTASVNRPGGSDTDADPTLVRLTDDGRFVIFSNRSNDLVANDTNNQPDVFIRDMLTGITERLTVGFDGSQANHRSFLSSITPDGRFVLFGSQATNLVPGDNVDTAGNLYRLDRQTGAVTIIDVTPAGAGQTEPFATGIAEITPDGRYVAFVHRSTQLVTGIADAAFTADVFWRDTVAGTTQMVIFSNSDHVSLVYI